MKTLHLLSVALLALPLACSSAKTEDNADAGAGGASGTGGTAGAGGTTAGDAATEGGTACGAVTDKGTCDKTSYVYCKAGVLTTVDCAKIGATCQVTAGAASCAMERAESCGTLTKLGECQGATVRYCHQAATDIVAVPREINCAAYGQICSPTGAPGDNGAYCVPRGACPATMPTPVENGTCTGNELSFCEGGNEYVFDCGIDTCKAVAGISDCFMTGVTIGCSGATLGCDATTPTTAVSCQGGIVTREDCAALGMTCMADATLGAKCVASTCPVACPTGYACQGDRCTAVSTPTRNWTFAVYIVGDNNLSDAAFDDLNEMETVGSTADVQVVTEFEFSSRYATSPPDNLKTHVWRMPIVADQDKTTLGSASGAIDAGDINMSDPANMSAFIKWAAETYPANHMAVILWNHGGGYQGGFIDESQNGSMSLRQLLDAVRESGVHPDVLGFDACLMGMHEVAMSFRGVADVLIGSEEVEPGAGYPYDTILTHLTQTPTMTAQQLGSTIVTDYGAYYAASPRQEGTTQGAFDLTKAESVNAALATFSQTLLTEMPGNRTDVRTVVASPALMRFKHPDSADLVSALTQFETITGNIATAATTFQSALSTSGYMIAKQGTFAKSEAGGVALYLPSAAFSDYTNGTFESYREDTQFLPLNPWHAVLANLTSGQDTAPVDAGPPSPTATKNFSVVLRWGNVPDGTKSGADLDLYVYEPNGDFGTPSNGTFTENGDLSADSYDTDIPAESYSLKPDHQAGTYIVLAHVYDIPAGEKAYPRLQIFRSDLPGGTRTMVRGKLVNGDIQEFPMDKSAPLEKPIDSTILPGVMNLDYTNIWYATTIEVIQ